METPVKCNICKIFRVARCTIFLKRLAVSSGKLEVSLNTVQYVTLDRILMLKVKARARHAFTLKQKNLF